LIQCLHSNYDSTNFTRFLQNYSVQNVKYAKHLNKSNDSKAEHPPEVVGRILFTVLTQIPTEKRVNIFTVILNEFAKEEVYISREQVRRITSWLKTEITDEIVKLLANIEDHTVSGA